MSKLLRMCNARVIAVFVLLCLPMVGWTQSTLKEASKAAKITPDLYQVMQNRGQLASAVVDGLLVETNQVFLDDKIAIEAVANSGDGEGLLNQLRALGLADGVAYQRMVFGYLPIDKIGELRNVSSLSFARSHQKPVTNTGSVTSQGDAALKADLARTTYGVTGAGVKVGVLSDSYNKLGGAALGVSTDDLPAEGVQVLQELATGGSDEGRAMAEIIHDVAPGSAIAFTTAFGGQPVFAQGILNLAAAGCQVIVDDVINLFEPFFQDGVVAQAADQVVNNGVSYFSAAGNQARSSYQAPYKSGGTYTNLSFFGTNTAYPTHDFGSGAVDNLQNITLPAGGSIRLAFQWDNPFQSVSGGVGATTDLDILFLNSTTGAVLGSGAANQSSGGDPAELTNTYTNTTGAPLNINIIIVKFSGPDPGLIKWINFGSRNITIEYDTKSGASWGHSNSARAISVGAAGWFATPVFNGAPTATIETFSSAGGTPILFTTTGERINGIVGTVRQKPEITSVDGGNTTFFTTDSNVDPDAFPNFFGTSAAAPHAAAVAALMKQKVPTITPATILSTLQSTALDMDDPAFPGFETGFDFGTGFGFIQADRALQAISNTAPTVANTIAPQSGTVNQAFTFTIPTNTFTDTETPTSLTVSVSGLPAGLMFANGTITGTPSASGVSTVTVKATDPGSLSVSTTFQLTINPAAVVPPANTPPSPPAGGIPNQVATVGTAFTYQVPAFTDPDAGQTLTYSVTGLPANGLSFNAATRTISGTPSASGTVGVTVTANDGNGGTASSSFTITINAAPVVPPANTPPTVANTIAPQSGTVNQAFSFTIPPGTFTDTETPGSLVVSVGPLPPGLSASGGLITGTPSASGVSTVTVTATDPGSLSVSTTFQLTINPAPVVPPANTPPTVANTIAPQSGTVGVGFSFTIPANTFADSETPGSLVVSVSGLPAGLSASGSTITGTPSASGVSTVTVTATDPGSLSVSTTFQLTINPASVVVPPTGGPLSITGVTTVSCTTLSAVLRQVSFTPQYAGTNGQPISFSVVSELSPTTAPGPYTLNLYTDNPTISLRATQSGTAGEASFAYNWLAACGGVVVPPPPTGTLSIAGVTTVSCTTLSSDRRQISFTPQYAGSNGQPISFSVVNELAPTTAPGPYTLSLFTDNPIITLKASQSGSAGEASFGYNWLAACGGVVVPPPPPTGTLSITGVTTVSCTPITAGLRQVSFTPQYAGANGQPISFSVVSELSPTTAPGPYTINLYTDNPTITLKATQSGTVGEASFAYNWLAACNVGARLGRESTTPMSVALYPNPVGEEFAISIRGAQGQTVRIMLTDVSGRSVSNTSVDVTTSDQREKLRFNQERAGLYLLRVSTAKQVVTLKVIKQ